MQPLPPRYPERVNLYSGRFGFTRVLFVIVILLTMIFLVPLLGFIVGVLVAALWPTSGVTAGLIVGLLTEFAMLAKLLSVTRAAAWLEGSVLAVRTAFATRRCDLANAWDAAIEWPHANTAVIPTGGGGFRAVPTGGRVPLLRVQERSRRRMFSFRMVDPNTGEVLAPEKLIALANLLYRGHDEGGSEDVAVLRNVAAELHAIATG